MPKAIETQIAPAIRKYTNIPSKMEEGYEFHELGPSGEVITDPAEFADLQVNAPTPKRPSYLEYAEKIKSDMGDPYEINVDAEARKILAEQERDIFKEWSGGQYQYPGQGYVPPKVKKAWGDYRQRLYANAQKLVQDKKEEAIKEYQHRLTEYKTNEEIEMRREQEERLSKGGEGKAEKISGGLTESQAIQIVENMFYSKGQQGVGIRKYQDFLAQETSQTDNIYEAREKAVYKLLEWKQKVDNEGGDLIKEAGELKPGVNAPPKGYTDTGKFMKGKRVWLSPDGTKAWVEE